MYRLVFLAFLIAACTPSTQRSETNPRLLGHGYCLEGDDCPEPGAEGYRMPTPRAAAVITRL